jgi:chromosome partitioning protein
MAKSEMFSVLVGNIKGGCGKTTIATHIASAFAAEGYATVLADCDRQRSSLRWLERRPETASTVAGLDWSKSAGRTPDETERLVIDAPAAMRHRDAKELVGLADVIIVPVLPSLFDEDATAYFLRKLGEIKSVRKQKRSIALVANRIRLGTNAAEELETYFAKREPGLIARLRDSQIYPALSKAGMTVFEDGSARARAYAAEWQKLLDLVDLGTRPAGKRQAAE